MIGWLLQRRFTIDLPDTPDVVRARLQALPRTSDTGLLAVLYVAFTWDGIGPRTWHGRVGERDFDLLFPSQRGLLQSHVFSVRLRGEWDASFAGTRLRVVTSAPPFVFVGGALGLILFGLFGFTVSSIFRFDEWADRVPIALCFPALVLLLNAAFFQHSLQRAERAFREVLLTQAERRPRRQPRTDPTLTRR